MKFVVGDIHGEISKLKELIDNIFVIDKYPIFIFIGDYINKGENSKKVLDYLFEFKNKFKDTIFLMGNHEYYYIQYIKKGMYKEKILKYGLETTFKDFDMSFDNIKEKLYLPYRAIFDNLKFFYETDEYFISHAGISLDSVDKDFNILSADKFLFNRYGFLNYKKKIHNKISIFGHTGFNYPYYDGYKIGVDTSAVYTKENRLTAYCLEEKFFINNKNEKLYLKNIKIDRTPWINRIEPYRMEKKK